MITLPFAERFLSDLDPLLGSVIASQRERWPSEPSEDPIWGLVRIVIAQQITTKSAFNIARKLLADYPGLASTDRVEIPPAPVLRKYGVPERRAKSCVEILTRAQEILALVGQGMAWEVALTGVKGIGPWTISTFKIMVLRESDVFPRGDVGLARAIARTYGYDQDIEKLVES